jgi:hypothetical protein
MATDTENGPPPAKRARLGEPENTEDRVKHSEKAVNSIVVREGEMDEEEEEEVMNELDEDTRPSDLYLDTVRGHFGIFIFSIDSKRTSDKPYGPGL